MLPRTPVLALAPSSTMNRREMLVGLIAGATGYVLMPQRPNELLDAITRATQGLAVLCTEAQNEVVTWLHDIGLTLHFHGFSSREQQILVCLVEGLTDKEIGARLGVAANTVHVHLGRIFKKMDTHTRAETLKRVFAL